MDLYKEEPMKITRIDRKACRTIDEAAEKALQEVAEKFGLTVKRESGRFDSTKFTAKFSFLAVGESGVPKDFRQCASLVGLDPDCYGKVFRSNGEAFRVTGINLRRRKYPVSAERVKDGRSYKFSAENVMWMLRAAA